MRKIREIMRLKLECGCSNHLIATSIGVSSSTVSSCMRRVRDAGLQWPLPDGLDDEKLSAMLYQPIRNLVANEDRGEIDWLMIHKELKRKHMTLMLLWQEYRSRYPKGISYSQFCHSYRQWAGQLDTWMRQSHKAGEKCFVDYAGTKVPIVDRLTGVLREAEIFVAALGASNYIYAEATWTQQLPDWIQSHVNTFKFYGGVPEIIVPDNLKTGINKAHRYEPDINPTYQDMACHYGIIILPTRVASPQDKAKVENAVLQVERRILAKLRDRTFFSLQELNQAISLLLTDLNTQPFQKLPGSRQSHFEELEKPALKPLPTLSYQFSEWKKARPGPDYHIELDRHYYSVPYTFIKKELDIRYTQKTVEVFYKGKRIASHVRSYKQHSHSTINTHMPKKHQIYAQWTPERMVNWAGKTGIYTAKLIEQVMGSRRHPEQGYRACLGILRLSKSYGSERLESACQRALAIGAYSFKSIESILKNGLDLKPLPDATPTTTIPAEHKFVRGREYFN